MGDAADELTEIEEYRRDRLQERKRRCRRKGENPELCNFVPNMGIGGTFICETCGVHTD